MPLSQTKLRSSSSPSIRVAEFAGFLSIYKYQLGGLNGTVSPYLYGKRGSYFIVNPGKTMPIFRKGTSFAHSVGYFLGSISLAGSSKYNPNNFFKKALQLYLDFYFFLVGGVRGVLSRTYFDTLAASRFWKSPFRLGYYGRWIPGAFTNYANVAKAYIKRSAPKFIVYRHRLSSDLQSWFLPKWFPSFVGIFDMLSSAPAIREAARLGVPNMGVGAVPVGRITVSEVTYPIIGYPSASSAAVVFNVIVQNYYKGLALRFEEVIVSSYQKVLIGNENAFRAAFPFNRKKADAIFSPEDYVRIVSGKITYEQYLIEQRRLQEELEEERKKQSRIDYFEAEEKKLLEKHPELANNKHRPTPVQRAVIFYPMLYSQGKPYTPRSVELERRRDLFRVLEKAGTYTPEQLGSFLALNHGLYTDYFDKRGFLYPGKTLWNKKVEKGKEDHVSKRFLRSYKGPRPDKVYPSVDYGLHEPGSPGWNPKIYEEQERIISEILKRRGKNNRANKPKTNNRFNEWVGR